MSATSTDQPDIDILRTALTGDAHLPGTPEYDTAGQAWNLTVHQRPALVVEAADARDVAMAIDHARRHGLRVAPQGTGHGAASLGDLSGTLLLRTGRMRSIAVDPVARRARVGAGALWDEVVFSCEGAGLTPLAGSSPDVGVAGYALGGGIGWLARLHGLASNSITAVELVTADGRVRRVDARHEPDLFWAVRGGGGNFGVVTAIELELFRAPEIYAGSLFWPWEQATAVLGAWREWIRTVPDEVTSIGRLLQLPPIPELPEPLRGRRLVAVEIAFAGSEEDGRALLAPLRALAPEIDTMEITGPTGLLGLHGDPVGPSAGIVDHALLGELTHAGIDALVAVAGPGSGSPLVSVELRHLDGALAQAPAGAGALATVDASFLAATVGVPMAPGDARAITRHAGAVLRALSPWSGGRTYLNFSERVTDTRTMFPAETHRRLSRIRAQVDPDGLLHANHVIDPAA